MADPGEVPGGPLAPLIFRPNWGPKKKILFWDRPPPPTLSQGLDDHPAPLSEGLDPPLTTPAYLQKVESTWDRRTLWFF